MENAEAQLRRVVSEMANLKQVFDETKEAIDVKKEQIAELMSSMGIAETHSEDERGNPCKAVLVPEGKSSRFDKKKAAESLLTKGVSPGIVKECFETAAVLSPRKAYIRLTFS